MGSYRNDDEALIGLARQLTDAYGEASTHEDQDYACDSIAEYLSEFRDAAPSEALVAILDLPLTVETYPLVDETQVALASRGPAVVELLLEAVLGDVYDPDGPAPERAAETLDSMDPAHTASMGLCEVLCGRGDDQLKGAAIDALVALGRGGAGPHGHGRRPGGWRVGAGGARAAEVRARESQRRSRRPGGGEDVAATEPRPVAGGEPVTDDRSAVEDEPVAEDNEGAALEPAAPQAGTGPDQGLVDEPTTISRRYEQEPGESRRPNLAQPRLNTGFIFAWQSVYKPRTAETVAPPTVVRVRLLYGAPPPSRDPPARSRLPPGARDAVGPSGPRRAQGARRGPSPVLDRDRRRVILGHGGNGLAGPQSGTCSMIIGIHGRRSCLR